LGQRFRHAGGRLNGLVSQDRPLLLGFIDRDLVGIRLHHGGLNHDDQFIAFLVFLGVREEVTEDRDVAQKRYAADSPRRAVGDESADDHGRFIRDGHLGIDFLGINDRDQVAADVDAVSLGIIGLANFKGHVVVGVDEWNDVQLQQHVFIGNARSGFQL
jgi:hypothetical protein